MKKVDYTESTKHPSFWQKHKRKLYIAGGILLSVLATGGAYYLCKNSNASLSNLQTSTVIPNYQEPKSQQFFCGVSLDELDKLAKNIYHGKRAYIYKGYLIFEYTSNSRKTIFRPQLRLDEDGKLINLGGHYPGQWWSPSDEFAKQANSRFTFVPEMINDKE